MGLLWVRLAPGLLRSVQDLLNPANCFRETSGNFLSGKEGILFGIPGFMMLPAQRSVRNAQTTGTLKNRINVVLMSGLSPVLFAGSHHVAKTRSLER